MPPLCHGRAQQLPGKRRQIEPLELSAQSGAQQAAHAFVIQRAHHLGERLGQNLAQTHASAFNAIGAAGMGQKPPHAPGHIQPTQSACHHRRR